MCGEMGKREPGGPQTRVLGRGSLTGWPHWAWLDAMKMSSAEALSPDLGPEEVLGGEASTRPA